MKRTYLPTFSLLAVLFISCSSNEEPSYEPEPVYSELVAVESITARSAIFTIKMNFPISQNANGYYEMDGKLLWEYGVYYTTNPDQMLRYWQFVDQQVEDPSGTYTLQVTGLSPSTKYYVKSWALTTRDQPQQQGFINSSENTLEFETLPD
jgi:hypothetical protein